MINAFITDDFSIKYVAHYWKPRSRCSTRSRHLGRPRRLDHVLGVPALDLRLVRRLHESRTASRADPYVVATISVVEMFFLF
jgi:hypothetical protein